MTKKIPLSELKDPRICRKHRQWMKKGQCIRCMMELEAIQKSVPAPEKKEIIIRKV